MSMQQKDDYPLAPSRSVSVKLLSASLLLLLSNSGWGVFDALLHLLQTEFPVGRYYQQVEIHRSVLLVLKYLREILCTGCGFCRAVHCDRPLFHGFLHETHLTPGLPLKQIRSQFETRRFLRGIVSQDYVLLIERSRKRKSVVLKNITLVNALLAVRLRGRNTPALS